MRRAAWTAVAAGLVVAVGFPAAAGAKTVVVDANGPNQCSGTAPQCRTLTDASGAASSGDTVEVHPGFYPEKPTFGQADITIRGTGSGLALVVGRLTLSNAGNVTISRLVLQSADETPLVVGSGTIPVAHSVTVEGTSLLAAKPLPALSVSVAIPPLTTATATARHVTAVNTGGPAISMTGSGTGAAFNATVANSIALGGVSPSSVTVTNTDTSSNPSSLFCDAVLHLVSTSPARGAGGSLDTGEVAEDIDGEARGTTPDRGADQYSNRCDPAPQAPPQLPPTSGLPPAVAGGPSAPSVQITKPKQREVLKRSRHRRRGSHRRPRPRPLTFTGTAADQLGLASIQLALRKTGTGTTTCQWFDGRKLRKVPCGQVVLLRGTLHDFAWTYTIPSSASLPKGSYLLYATAINRAGVAQTTFTKGQNVVGFKVK
jgi:hypothetical protein